MHACALLSTFPPLNVYMFVLLLLLLQVLASKLGEEPSTLLIGAADAVVAHMLWFSADRLEHFTKFVDSVMAPESTFITVVTVRHVLYMHRAGHTCSGFALTAFQAQV